MQLKSTRRPYRRRSQRRTSWARVFIYLILIGAGVLLLYRLQETPGVMQVSSTATPLPTPTRSISSYTAEAVDFYIEGKFSQAIAAYRLALEADPTRSDLYFDLARLLVFHGRPERALQMAREGLRLDPENAFGWAVMGLAYDWLGVPEEAVEVCSKAVALDPTLPEAYAYLAEAYIDAGGWFAANDAIATALQLDDTNVDVRRNYGYVLEMQGNYSAAIAAYRDLLADYPNLPHVYTALGRNQQVLQYFQQAQSSFAAAAEIDDGSANALDMLGWGYLLQGEYDRAQPVLEQALAIEPTHARAAGHLGTLFFQRRNYEDAIPQLENAVRYGEFEARRQVVFFRVTEEPAAQLNAGPAGREVLRGEFVFPEDVLLPIRATLNGEEPFADVAGYVRLNPLDGRYAVRLAGLPPLPEGQVYVGWFEPLLTPERLPIRTVALTPNAQGVIEATGGTGSVKGPPIETYYTLSLCYYYLDQCADAQPYIDVALRIDPEDANALQTQRLCAGP
ncbi:MAG: tetratricopeptide repeat protein [Anaerolineae bacterium]|nr:tetratricopeptide repeat protein [Anaerolineae bacterium]